MNYHPKVCSFFPLLVQALAEVPGDVLELGAGIHSTSFLHWMCLDQGRELHTYETEPAFYNIAKLCEADWHKVHLVEDWDAAPIDREWGIVLVDHAPSERRKVDAVRLADRAQVILLHDSQGRADKHYHYQEIRPLFRYRGGWGKGRPQTTAVSNFRDVSKWARR